MEINYLPELEEVLSKHGIHKEDVCVVGSAVLAYHNLRENNDIDLIVRHTRREHKTEYSIGKNIEIVQENWLYMNEDITDDLIIDNEKYHFRHQGYKFVVLPLLEMRKSNSTREKDHADIKLMKRIHAG